MTKEEHRSYRKTLVDEERQSGLQSSAAHHNDPSLAQSSVDKNH